MWAQRGPRQSMTCKWQSPHSAKFGSTISLSPNFQTTVNKKRRFGQFKFILCNFDVLLWVAHTNLVCQLMGSESGDHLLVQQWGNSFLIEQSCLLVCDQSPVFHRCRTWVWQCNLIWKDHINMDKWSNSIHKSAWPVVCYTIQVYPVGSAEKTRAAKHCQFAWYRMIKSWAWSNNRLINSILIVVNVAKMTNT